GGPALLLYAPIDTLTTGIAEHDVPGVGPELRPDMVPVARRIGDLVVGLGAGNPKGHAACVVAAAEAIASCGQALAGDLLVGLGAGGMPTNAWRSEGRRNVGHGVGCAYLLEQGCWPDFAVVAKPGWTVSREEVGLCWFDITVHGTHTYVGSRHRLPYRNAIADAAEVVRFLEAWFPRYSEQHRGGEVAPQGIVAAIEGGWSRLAAVTPASCRIRVDLRTSPRTSPAEARRVLAAALEELRAEVDGINVELAQVLAIPAGSTSADSWITRCAVAAWEEAEGREHRASSDLSGATDANILRGRGIPTVRVGMPKVTEAPFPIDFAAGMNTVNVQQMARLTRLLIACAVETCGRSLAEVGL
ncbi:MAG: deacylase, partial [Acidimicrobiaceae bacterium]|nr:deacylase [Acidimicrobiaceae bacterium]